jgi:hypothetical protein
MFFQHLVKSVQKGYMAKVLGQNLMALAVHTNYARKLMSVIAFVGVQIFYIYIILSNYEKENSFIHMHPFVNSQSGCVEKMIY